MRVTIDYNEGKPHYISFEYIEYQDSLLFMKILDKVLVRGHLSDLTYAITTNCEMRIDYRDSVIRELSFDGDTDLIQRLIHLTVANHWHMLKQECLWDIEKETTQSNE